MEGRFTRITNRAEASEHGIPAAYVRAGQRSDICCRFARLAVTIAERGMSIWLLTGASGFVGRHVLDVLQLRGRRACAGREQGCRSWPTLPAGLAGRPISSTADLDDLAGLRQAMEQIAPDFVVHTAGKTPPAPDDELYRANFWGTMHLLSALRPLKKPVRVVLSGSAAELGSVDPRPTCRSVRAIPAIPEMPMDAANGSRPSEVSRIVRSWRSWLAGYSTRSAPGSPKRRHWGGSRRA